MQHERIGRHLRLAEFAHAFLVQHARHGVHAFDAAAVGEDLRRAVIEQSHRARSRRRSGRGLRFRERDRIAIGPRQEPRTLVERQLLPQLQIARNEAQRSPPGLGRTLGLAEQLEQAGQPPQRLGTARSQGSRCANRRNR